MRGALIIAGLALTAAVAFGGAHKEAVHPWVQEYTAGQGNIKGDVDTGKYLEIDERLEIGADAGGMAVFKDPAAALRCLEEKYSKGIELIRREFGLLPPKFDFAGYKTYGWQVTGGTEEERQQALFVSQFMDIYENSF